MTFFYGLKPHEIDEMPWPLFCEYWQAITMIEAQVAMMDMQINDYPQMKRENRKKLHKKIHKMAFPEAHKEKGMTPELAALALGKALNG